ncbi:MAG: hypothetical protein AB7Q17_00540 [Phycisphaerae bacterium]
MLRRLSCVTMLAGSVVCTSAAFAADARLRVSAPSNTVPRHVEVSFTSADGTPVLVPVPIPPALTRTPTWKRDLIVEALSAAGQPASAGPGDDELTIHNVAAGSEVQLRDVGTGEVRDSIAAPGVLNGGVAFPGFFDPFDYRNAPAVFTAGIVTDVGELSVQISAQELSFQTEGPIICQALFQRLAPRAPQYGAEVLFAGDRLEVYFDPAYTVQSGGIVFGTSSRGEGNAGFLTLPHIVDACWDMMIGDANGDGALDNFDIDPFVEALVAPEVWQQQYPHLQMSCVADVNLDGAIDNFDIDAFVSLLVAPRVVVRTTAAAGEVFCRYEVESSTNSASVKRGDYLCINCPTDGSDCPDQRKFRLLDANGNAVADGTWRRVSDDCTACERDNRRGYGF